MNDYGKMTESGTLYFKRMLPGPVERVWEYLTDSEKRGQWLASGKMELEAGGKVELIFDHQKLTPHDERPPEKYKDFTGVTTYQGKIKRLDPPRLLSFSWEEESGESEVTFELTPKGERVLLELTHRNLGDDMNQIISGSAGWHTHLGILVDKMNNKDPRPFWKEHSKLEEAYTRRLAE